MDADARDDCGPVLQAEGGEVQAGGDNRTRKRNKYVCEWKDLNTSKTKVHIFWLLSSIKYIKMKYMAVL